MVIRTNIVIDEKLMGQAMRLSGLSTKKDVVNSALKEYVERRTRKDLTELQGKIQFTEGYDYKAMRKGH